MPLRYTKSSMKIISKILDIIFPPRKTELLVNKAQNNRTSLQRTGGKFKNISFITNYSNELVSACIRENKFFHNLTASALLGEILKSELRKISGDVTIIPIPLSKERLRERGHNQVETIAKHTGVSVRTDLLERTVHTAPQTSLDKNARLKNLDGAFTCKNPEKLMYLENTTVILLDDVTTTGATLESARKVLKPIIHPSSTLICIAIAH
jgi:competence protein ComFC